MTKTVNPFTAITDDMVVRRPGVPYVLPAREPDVISDETVAAITQAVTQVFTELAAAKRKQTKRQR